VPGPDDEGGQTMIDDKKKQQRTYQSEINKH
jgi:hypothetical protein